MSVVDPTLGGMAPTHNWRVKSHFNFICEIDSDVVRPLVPTRLALKEARPGVGLLNIGYMALVAGHLDGQLPEFEEITFSVHVHPDLTLKTSIPRMSVYDIRIGSNCKAFLDYEAEHQKLNGTYWPTLRGTLNDAQDQLTVQDESGPLFTLKNTHPSPPHKMEDAVGQYYSMYEGQLYQGVFRWTGRGTEHQRDGDWGQLFNHPFFREIDVERNVFDCYMQMFMAPDSNPLFYSFYPRRFE